VPHGDVAPWVIVIGCSQHTHMRPTLLPFILQTRQIINVAMAADCDAVGRVTTRDVMIRIERATGLNAPAGTVSRMLREQRRAAEPYGSSIAALDALATSTHGTYVQDVCGFVSPSDPNDLTTSVLASFLPTLSYSRPQRKHLGLEWTELTALWIVASSTSWTSRW
jgi:hypothetical protein